MAPSAKRRRSNDARRRKTLRRVSANERWMHLSAGDTAVRNTLQYCWEITTRISTYSVFLLALSHVVQDAAVQGADMEMLADIVSAFTGQKYYLIDMLQFWRRLDHYLYNIPRKEESQPCVLMRRKHLRIDNLSDPEAYKMTYFYHSQLRCL